MLTWGVLVLLVNFIYLIFSFLVGTVAYFIAKKYRYEWRNRIALMVSFVVLVVPFWDLILQKGIKTYYEMFKMEETIYAYPERDADGKIESLGIYKNVSDTNSGYLSELERFQKLKNAYAVNTFLECYMSGSFMVDENGKVHENYRNNLGYVRVDLSSDAIHYEKVKDETEYRARYQITGTVTKNIFYTKKQIYFKDVKNNILLAEGFQIIFSLGEKDAFRNKYLLWISGNGVPFGIKSLGNYGTYFRLLAYNK